MHLSSRSMVRWVGLLGLVCLLGLSTGGAAARQRVTRSHAVEAGALAVTMQCSADGIICTTTYVSVARTTGGDTTACLSASTRELLPDGLSREIAYEFGCQTGQLGATFDQRLTGVSLPAFQLQLNRETCDEVDCTVIPTRVVSLAAEFTGYGERTRLKFHEREQWGSCRYVSNGKGSERAANAVITLDGVATAADSAKIYHADSTMVLHCAE